MTRTERDQLIQTYEATYTGWLDAYRNKRLKGDELNELKRKFRSIKTDYFRELPRLPLSRCPYTGEPLLRAFDPWGVDGYWWQEGEFATYAEPPPPPTFAVLTGALNLGGKPPCAGPREEAHVGPDVPFVIPRLLNLPGMIAVIGCVNMENGYRAYPIAYFSKEKPVPGTLTSTWRRTSYDWQDSAGQPCFSHPADPWDFDLKPWIAQGKVMWIAPDDRSQKLLGKDDGRCPFVDLPGKRERQILIRDKMRLEPAPNGEKLDPFNE